MIGWSNSQLPNDRTIGDQFLSEGLDYIQWSNRPGEAYSAHRHSFGKVIYVVEGSITFGIPEKIQSLELSAGDRLELPAGVLHSAVVGSRGVVCYESQIKKESIK